MLRCPWLACAILALSACAAEPDDGLDGGGGPDMTPMPEILSFTARDTSVRPQTPTELRWRVKNALSVEIGSPGETLASAFVLDGVVETRALVQDTRFFITARNGAKSATAELAVDVEWQPPEIVDFSIQPNPALAMIPAQVHVETRFVTWIRLIGDGRVLTEQPFIFTNNGFFTVTPRTSTSTFRLEAGNPEGETGRDLEFSVREPAQIVHFSGEPRTAFAPVFTATVSWETRGADFVELWEDGTFFGRLDPVGSVQRRVGRAVSYVLNASGAGGFTASAQTLISPATAEQEPNDTLIQAHDISVFGGVRARISTETDADTFAINQQFLARRLVVRTSGESSPCDVDTSVRVFSAFDRSLLATFHDGGAAAPGGGACAADELAVDPTDFRGQAVFVQVTGTSTGTYRLEAYFVDR